MEDKIKVAVGEIKIPTNVDEVDEANRKILELLNNIQKAKAEAKTITSTGLFVYLREGANGSSMGAETISISNIEDFNNMIDRFQKAVNSLNEGIRTVNAKLPKQTPATLLDRVKNISSVSFSGPKEDSVINMDKLLKDLKTVLKLRGKLTKILKDATDGVDITEDAIKLGINKSNVKDIDKLIDTLKILEGELYHILQRNEELNNVRMEPVSEENKNYMTTIKKDIKRSKSKVDRTSGTITNAFGPVTYKEEPKLPEYGIDPKLKKEVIKELKKRLQKLGVVLSKEVLDLADQLYADVEEVQKGYVKETIASLDKKGQVKKTVPTEGQLKLARIKGETRQNLVAFMAKELEKQLARKGAVLTTAYDEEDFESLSKALSGVQKVPNIKLERSLEFRNEVLGGYSNETLRDRKKKMSEEILKKSNELDEARDKLKQLKSIRDKENSMTMGMMLPQDVELNKKVDDLIKYYQKRVTTLEKIITPWQEEMQNIQELEDYLEIDLSSEPQTRSSSRVEEADKIFKAMMAERNKVPQNEELKKLIEDMKANDERMAKKKGVSVEQYLRSIAYKYVDTQGAIKDDNKTERELEEKRLKAEKEAELIINRSLKDTESATSPAITPEAGLDKAKETLKKRVEYLSKIGVNISSDTQEKVIKVISLQLEKSIPNLHKLEIIFDNAFSLAQNPTDNDEVNLIFSLNLETASKDYFKELKRIRSSLRKKLKNSGISLEIIEALYPSDDKNIGDEYIEYAMKEIAKEKGMKFKGENGELSEGQKRFLKNKNNMPEVLNRAKSIKYGPISLGNWGTPINPYEELGRKITQEYLEARLAMDERAKTYLGWQEGTSRDEKVRLGQIEKGQLFSDTLKDRLKRAKEISEAARDYSFARLFEEREGENDKEFEKRVRENLSREEKKIKDDINYYIKAIKELTEKYNEATEKVEEGEKWLEEAKVARDKAKEELDANSNNKSANAKKKQKELKDKLEAAEREVKSRETITLLYRDEQGQIGRGLSRARTNYSDSMSEQERFKTERQEIEKRLLNRTESLRQAYLADREAKRKNLSDLMFGDEDFKNYIALNKDKYLDLFKVHDNGSVSISVDGIESILNDYITRNENVLENITQYVERLKQESVDEKDLKRLLPEQARKMAQVQLVQAISRSKKYVTPEQQSELLDALTLDNIYRLLSAIKGTPEGSNPIYGTRRTEKVRPVLYEGTYSSFITNDGQVIPGTHLNKETGEIERHKSIKIKTDNMALEVPEPLVDLLRNANILSDKKTTLNDSSLKVLSDAYNTLDKAWETADNKLKPIIEKMMGNIMNTVLEAYNNTAEPELRARVDEWMQKEKTYFTDEERANKDIDRVKMEQVGRTGVYKGRILENEGAFLEDLINITPEQYNYLQLPGRVFKYDLIVSDDAKENDYLPDRTSREAQMVALEKDLLSLLEKLKELKGNTVERVRETLERLIPNIRQQLNNTTENEEWIREQKILEAKVKKLRQRGEVPESENYINGEQMYSYDQIESVQLSSLELEDIETSLRESGKLAITAKKAFLVIVMTLESVAAESNILFKNLSEIAKNTFGLDLVQIKGTSDTLLEAVMSGNSEAFEQEGTKLEGFVFERISSRKNKPLANKDDLRAEGREEFLDLGETIEKDGGVVDTDRLLEEGRRTVGTTNEGGEEDPLKTITSQNLAIALSNFGELNGFIISMLLNLRGGTRNIKEAMTLIIMGLQSFTNALPLERMSAELKTNMSDYLETLATIVMETKGGKNYKKDLIENLRSLTSLPDIPMVDNDGLVYSDMAVIGKSELDPDDIDRGMFDKTGVIDSQILQFVLDQLEEALIGKSEEGLLTDYGNKDVDEKGEEYNPHLRITNLKRILGRAEVSEDIVTGIKDTINNIIKLIKQVIPEIDTAELERINQASLGVDLPYNDLANLFNYSNLVDISNQRLVNEMRDRGVDITLEQRTKDWLAENQGENGELGLADRYRASQEVRRTFEANGGFKELKKSIAAVLNLDNEFVKSIKETYDKIGSAIKITIPKINDAGEKIDQIVELDTEELFRANFFTRIDPTKSQTNSDKRRAGVYYSSEGIVGEALPDRDSLSYSEITQLGYKGGYTGLTYGGLTIQESQEKIRAKIKEAEERKAQLPELITLEEYKLREKRIKLEAAGIKPKRGNNYTLHQLDLAYRYGYDDTLALKNYREEYREQFYLDALGALLHKDLMTLELALRQRGNENYIYTPPKASHSNVFFDTETTGTNFASDVPVSFAATKRNDDGTETVVNRLLTYTDLTGLGRSDWETTLPYLQKAMNIFETDKKTGAYILDELGRKKLIDSSKQLRKRFSLNEEVSEFDEVDFSKLEKTLVESAKQLFESIKISPKELLAELIKIAGDKSSFIGFNSNLFDMKMLLSFFGRNGVDFGENSDLMKLFSKRDDVRERLMYLFGDDSQGKMNRFIPNSFKLQGLVSLITGKESDEAHDALDDTRNTQMVYDFINQNENWFKMGGQLRKQIMELNGFEYQTRNEDGDLRNSSELNKVTNAIMEAIIKEIITAKSAGRGVLLENIESGTIGLLKQDDRLKGVKYTRPQPQSDTTSGSGNTPPSPPSGGGNNPPPSPPTGGGGGTPPSGGGTPPIPPTGGGGGVPPTFTIKDAVINVDNAHPIDVQNVTDLIINGINKTDLSGNELITDSAAKTLSDQLLSLGQSVKDSIAVQQLVVGLIGANIVGNGQNMGVGPGSMLTPEEDEVRKRFNRQNRLITINPIEVDFNPEEHKYIDRATGEQLLSSTQIRDLLLYGKKPENEDMRRMDEMVKSASVTAKNPLTAQMLGMEQSSFDFYLSLTKSGLYGDAFHSIIDTFATNGVTNFADLKEVDRKALGSVLANYRETGKKYGLSNDFLNGLYKDVLAYMDVYKKIHDATGLSLSQLSEIPLGAEISDGFTSHKFAGTFDLLFLSSRGGAFVDNKTGGVHGFETILLSLQKALALANEKILLDMVKGLTDENGNQILLNFKDINTGYIADVKNGAVRLIENRLLEMIEIFDLIDRAIKINNGEGFALGEAEKKIIKAHQLASGRFIGNVEGVNPDEAFNEFYSKKKDKQKGKDSAILEVFSAYENYLREQSNLHTLDERERTLEDKLYKVDENGKYIEKDGERVLTELGEEFKKTRESQKQLVELLQKIVTGKIGNEGLKSLIENEAGLNLMQKIIGGGLEDKDLEGYLKSDDEFIQKIINSYLKDRVKQGKVSVSETDKRDRALKREKKSDLSEDKLKNNLMNEYLKKLKEISDLEVKINRNKNDMGRVSTADRRELENTNRKHGGRISELYTQLPKYDKENLAFIDKDGKQIVKLTNEENSKFLQEQENIENRKNESIARTNAQLTRQRGILEQLTNSFKEELNSIFNYQIGNRMFNALENTLRNIIEYTKQLDANMVDLLIASGESYSNIYDLTKQFNELGNELGRTTSEVMLAANDWLRAGYDSKEAAELTKASMNLSTLGMINSSDATSYLISMLKGWKLETEEVNAVVDRLTAVDMAAAISAGDLAEGLSRANTSAQLAGSTMDNFIGYVTTIADVSQKSASSVGESMKTLYARFLNAAAGKFAATQEEIDSGNYNEDEYSNINDIETAARAVGIRIRDSIDHFRNFDDVLAEVASKWDSFSNVQQAGLATSFAGVRQRENFVLLMENWESVSRYAKIAEESVGTAQQKMLAYTDSIEAAKNRTTTALEQLALDLNLTDRIKDFYDVITYLTENLGKLSMVIGTILIATNGRDIAKGLGNGFISASNTTMASNNLLNGLAGVGLVGSVKNGLSGFRDQVYREDIAQIQYKYENQLKRLFPRFGDTEIEVLKNFKTKAGGLTADSVRQINKYLLLKLTSDDLDSYFSSAKIDAGQQKLIKELANTAQSVDNLNDDGIAKLLEMGQNEENAIGGINSTQSIMQRLGSIAGMGVGGFAGFELGEGFVGEGFGTVGSMLGMAIGSYAGSEFLKSATAAILAGGSGANFIGMISAFAKSFTSPFLAIPAILITAVGTVWAINEKMKKDFLKELEEEYKKTQENYSEALNASAQVAEYDKLVEGVDSLGRNISLTNEDYSRFLEISENLAGVFPQLETRVNSAGDTFILNGGKVGKMTEAVDALTESLREQRDLDLLNSKVSIDGEEISLMQRDLEKVKEARKLLDKQNDVEKKLASDWILLKAKDIPDLLVSYEYTDGNPNIGMGANIGTRTAVAIDIEATKEIINNKMIPIREEITEIETELADIENLTDIEIKTLTTKKEELGLALLSYSDLLDVLKEITTDEAKAYAKKENRVNRLEALEEYNKTTKAITDYTNAIINTTPKLKAAYEAMNEEEQALADSLNQNLTLSGNESDAEVAQMVLENIDSIDKLVNNYSNSERMIRIAYELEPDIVMGDFTRQRNEDLRWILENIEDEEMIKTILVALQFEMKDPEGDVKNFWNWFDKNNPLQSLKESDLAIMIEDVTNLDARNKADIIRITDTLSLLKGLSDETFSVSELESMIAKSDFNDSVPLEDMVKAYEEIKDGPLTNLERELKKVLEELFDKWAEDLGKVKGDYDGIIEKIKMIGNLDVLGTTEKSIADILADRESYEEIAKYLANDYDAGEGWDNEIVDKILSNEKLLPYFVDNDIKGLTEAVNLQLNETEDAFLDSYQGRLMRSEAFMDHWIKNNADAVDKIKEDYNIDLNNFETFKEAETKINDVVLNGFNQNYKDWVLLMGEIYKTDLDNFSEAADKKARMNELILRDLQVTGVMSDDTSVTTISAGYEKAARAYVLSGGKTSDTYMGVKFVDKDGNLLYKNTKEGKINFTTQALYTANLGANAANLLASLDALKGIADSYNYKSATTSAGKPKDSKSGSGSSDNLPDEKYKPSDYLETMESLINKEWEAMEVFDELTGKPKVIDVLVDDYGVKEFFDTYMAQLNEAKEAGIDLNNTIYGNIDTNNRQVINWTDEMINKFKWQLSTWGETYDSIVGYTSTVMGTLDNFEGIPVAYSPMLQTENGPVLLSSDAITQYIADIFGKANGDFSKENILKLDSEGLDKFGIHIKNMIADVGETAEKTSISMHYTGTDGAINGAYRDLQEAAQKAGISVEQLNEAIANNNIESVLGSKEVELQTKYFDKMRESIQKRLEQLRKDIVQSEKDYETLLAKADSYGDQKTKEAIEARNEAGDAYKELVDYQKQEIELQVQLNNLDDELVQDEISLAEAKNASLKTLIKLNQQLLWTADTEEERVQHNKTILDLLKQQYEEAKRVREFYQGYAERTKNVYSGTAWSNSTDYDTMQKYQFAYNEKNAQAILAERDRRFSIRYDELMDEGIYSEAEAKKLAMEDEEVLSLTEEYLDTIDKRAEIIYQGIEDKTDELDRKLDLIDKGRPKEWTNISQIQASYNTETAVLIEKLNVLNQGLAQAAYLTDELILNMVDEINDARIKLQEGNIALAEAIKGLQEKQFDAVKSKVEDYKNDLLDLIDAIELAYEDELKPLQENNEERKRAIELEEKLNAIKNKEKEKERVYRQGKNKILCPV